MLIVILGVDGIVAQMRGARWVFPWLLLEVCMAVGTAVAFPHKHLGTLRQLLLDFSGSSHFLGPAKHARVEARSSVVSTLLYLHDLAHLISLQENKSGFTRFRLGLLVTSFISDLSTITVMS